jgi:cytoskeleton-associated protein 5
MVTDEAAPAGMMMQRQNSFEPDSPFAAVLSQDPTSSVEALKVVQRQITEDTANLAGQADPLISAITMQMASAFEGLDADTPQATLRLCKHLMQTLSGFFDQKTLSLAVSREALIGLLAELTKRLLETAASEASEAISSLSKVLNMVLIRIFHNANRASTFG